MEVINIGSFHDALRDLSDASTAINHGLNPVRKTMDASTLGLYVATVFSGA